MNKRNEEKYISLQEATKYCNYSQEYLSLRVRQGKLKGIKFGRNWVTKKEWVLEYVENVANGDIVKKQQSSTAERKEIILLREVPSNLPMGQFSEKIQNLFIQEKPRFSNLNFLLLFLITSAVLLTGIFLNKELLGKTAYNFSIAVENTADKILGEKEKIFISNIKSFSVESWKFIKNTAYSLAKNTKLFAQNFFEKFIAIWKKPTEEKKGIAKEKVDETDFLKSTKEGRIVVPSEGLDKEALKEKIKLSFSDEVEVNPDDDNSGVIIPIFKQRKGEEYLYMLVPVKPVK